MSLFKSMFVICIGLLMAAAYLSMLVGFAHLTDRIWPSFGFVAFLGFSVGSALCLIRLQTELERYLIRRHVAQNPKSTWRYVVTQQRRRGDRIKPAPKRRKRILSRS